MTRAACPGFAAFSQACRTNIVHQQTDETKAVWPGSTVFTGTKWYISVPVDDTAARDQSNLVTGYSVLTSILTSISSKYNNPRKTVYNIADHDQAVWPGFSVFWLELYLTSGIKIVHMYDD